MDTKEEKEIGALIPKLPSKTKRFVWYGVSLDFVERNFSFILFVLFFILLYIANGHRSIKLIRKINKLSNEVTKMKYEYLIYKSELTDLTRQGNLRVLMEKIHLKLPKEQPIILIDTALAH